MTVRRWLLSAALASGVAGAAWQLRTLTAGGAAAAAAVGTVTCARGGPAATAALLAFFGGSSALSRYRAREKQRGVLAQAKGARRDAWQVLANGGLATSALLLPRAWAEPLFLGALATAAADTWATELGLLASQAPRLITTGRRVPAGTSGGVTPLGLLAAVLGAASVAGAWRCVRGEGNTRLAPASAVMAGCLGALVDSLLGATVQARYLCPVCSSPLETARHAACGVEAELTGGWRWVDNDVVNTCATLAGALIAAGSGLCMKRGGVV